MLLYSDAAEELRTIMRDVFGWTHVDDGQGWLIFAMPPSEIAVHPADSPAHQISFMCDDITATVAELSEKGVVFDGEPHDEGWGIVTTMVLPGGVKVMLYEPRHQTAI